MSPQLVKFWEGAAFAGLAAGGGIAADYLAAGKFDNHVWAVAGSAALTAIIAYLRQPPREDWHTTDPPKPPTP